MASIPRDQALGGWPPAKDNFALPEVFRRRFDSRRFRTHHVKNEFP
jgi:hypothetical protein